MAEDIEESFGKSTLTFARDVMSTTLVVLKANDTFRTAVELLSEKRLTVLPVVDPENKLLGLLSEKEILSTCKSIDTAAPNFLDDKIQFKKYSYYAYPDTPIEKIRKILSSKEPRHVPIVDKERKLIGIITRRDLIRVVFIRFELKVLQT